MKNLSACASTCVYWAQLIRPRIFSEPVLRSAKDLRDFQSLLRGSVWSARIGWRGSSCRWPRSSWIHLFQYSTTRIASSILFVPERVLPMATKLDIHLYVENICFPTPALLFNLLQDCLPLHPRRMSCRNLTWDHNLLVTPVTIGFTLACRQDHVVASGCTDDALVAAMVQGIRHTPHSLRRPIPQLSLPESFHLLDVMRSTYGFTEELRMESYPHSRSVKADSWLRMIEGAYRSFQRSLLAAFLTWNSIVQETISI